MWTIQLATFCNGRLDTAPGRSYLGHAAVDKEFDAGDVAALVRSEEDDLLGDVIGRTRVAQGRGGGEGCAAGGQRLSHRDDCASNNLASIQRGIGLIGLV
jgi:hypothetical protein